jgi:hypothetical protein
VCVCVCVCQPWAPQRMCVCAQAHAAGIRKM